MIVGHSFTPVFTEHPGRNWLLDLHAFLNSHGHRLAGALLFSTKGALVIGVL